MGFGQEMKTRTSPYACTLALRSARVTIFSGPSGPKFIADAFVVSEKVGEGGPGEVVRRREMVSERRERARGIVFGVVFVGVVVVHIVFGKVEWFTEIPDNFVHGRHTKVGDGKARGVSRVRRIDACSVDLAEVDYES